MDRQRMDGTVDEGESGQIVALVTDEKQKGLDGALLTSLKGKLYDDATKQILGGRNWQDLLANGGSVDASGNFLLQLTPTDNVLVTPTLRAEWHVLALEWKWSAGARVGRAEVEFLLIASENVP